MKSLEKVYLLFKKAYKKKALTAAQRSELKKAIQALPIESIDIKKLKELWNRLNPQDSPEHLNLMMIQMERILNRELSEQEFLITTQDRKQKRQTFPIRVILENIRSSFNVGSMVRTAEALGVEKIYLCGYTSTPENPKTLKASLGTEKWISWEFHPEIGPLLQELKDQGYILLGLETSQKSKNLYQLDFLSSTTPLVLVVGNERFGLQPQTLKQMDHIVEIPLYGQKNSLNVATALGIALSVLGVRHF